MQDATPIFKSGSVARTPIFELALKNVLYNYGDKNRVSIGLASWSGAATWLAANTTEYERLYMTYNYFKAGLIFDYLHDTHDYASFDSILHRTSPLKPLLYAKWVMDDSVLGALTSLTSLYHGLGQDTLSLAQHHIYGSSRIAMQTYPGIKALRSTYSVNPAHVPDSSLRVLKPWYSSAYGDLIKANNRSPWGNAHLHDTDTFRVNRIIANRWYNLTDHLGNVTAVIRDRKSGHISSGHYDYYNPDVIDLADYYPFGMKMPGRMLLDSNNYGYNGQRSERNIYSSVDPNLGKYDVHYTYKYREYDPRLGKFWSVDPLAQSYPWNSSYAFAENRVIDGLDLEGLEYANFMWTASGYNPNTSVQKVQQDFVKVMTNPETHKQAMIGIGQVAVTSLAGIFLEGLGSYILVEGASNSLIRTMNKTPEVPILMPQEIPLEIPVQHSPSFIADIDGVVYPVPRGATGPMPTTNGRGMIFSGGEDGANGQVSSVRFMEPTPAKGNAPAYPNGTVGYENANNQPVNPYSGRTLPKTESHFPRGVPKGVCEVNPATE